MKFTRQVEKELKDWQSRVDRKPLILRGARQVGKTTLIEYFAQSYKQFIHLNLEKKSDRYYFEKFEDVKKIVEALFIKNGFSAQLPQTLLFIDEIQESSKAIQLLRYFYEDIPELHVVAAGSLLEFALGEVKSFPVGRVEYLYLFPLNFPEFLAARNKKNLANELRTVPVKDIAHAALLEEFHIYAITGGMPELIKTFTLEKSMISLPRVFESIWETYKKDIEKYGRSSTEKKIIKHIMETAPEYLDQRVKFQNFGHSNYRSREVSEAMKSLDDAKVIQLIYPTTERTVPPKTNYRKSPRLQFLDTGLVNYALGILPQLMEVKDLSNAYKGALIPHLITQELISLNIFAYKKPHFWVRDKRQSSAEVDLVIPYKDKLIPVEIKSGSTGTLKSLQSFIDTSEHSYAIRIYFGTFKIEKHQTIKGKPYLLMNLPYYLGTQLHAYIAYFVEQH
ncbi:MAG: AAA family ATPase [Chitinophagales bacterium]